MKDRNCDGDQERNSHNAPLISPGANRVAVRVIFTDKELIIAKSVARVLRPAAQATA